MPLENQTRNIAFDGLDEGEARALLDRVGPNALTQSKSRNIIAIAAGTLREPMFFFLLAAALLYLVLGGLGEGLFLLVGAIVSIGLVVLQETRSERALAALKELAEPFARVIRSGSERRIPARNLVPGDLVLLVEGGRIPVDGVLVGGDALTVDESALTGESIPVSKIIADDTATPETDPAPGGDQTPLLFAGTLIVRGQGILKATRTGPNTSLGRIGASLAEIKPEPTLLQRTTTRLVAKLGILAFAFCALVFVAYGLFRGSWIEGALAAITLAIALLPEEFPMVLAVFMAIGAWRLAQRNVLVRRAAIIETLGAATILCVDKTGTLTENRMSVAALWVEGQLHEQFRSDELRSGAAHLIGRAALASAMRPIDPMDRAVRELASDLEDVTKAPVADGPLRTHPLRPNLLALIQLWPDGEGRSIIAAKGAPEAIFSLCRMDAATRQKMHDVVARMAEKGWRVLGVAARHHSGDLPDDLTEGPFVFEGLVGFVDPVRAEVPEALARARAAGIDVAMITGDYPATALEIARRAGINTKPGVLTGPDIASMDETALRAAVIRIRVFARVMPEQKFALVEALKANNHVVAMTGDGINDAPALEAAHIGIAMGKRGTDVAREASDIVLLDDSFPSIVEGVALGRRIFANLRKALTYVTAIHVPIGGLALFPILMGLPPMVFPMHVVLLELVVDPVCSLVFEAEPAEAQSMKKEPRPADESLFGARQVAFGLFQGAVVLAGVLGLYAFSLGAGLSESEARAAAFVALIFSNLVLAFADSAEPGTSFFDRRRIVFWIIGAVTAIITTGILYVPWMANIFRISPPDRLMLVLALSIAVLGGGWAGFLRRAGLLR